MQTIVNTKSKTTIILIAIIILAIGLRLGAAYYLGNSTPPGKDETSYSILAMRVATGYGFSFPQTWYPGFTNANEHTAHWSFIYTSFVGVNYALFGFIPLLVRLISAVICGVLLPLTLYLLSHRVWPESDSLPLVSAALGAVYGYFVLFGARIQTEGFFIIVVLWSLERALAMMQVLRSKEVNRKKIMVVSGSLGLSLGLATLLRQSILPWIGILIVILFFVGWQEKHLRRTVICLLGSGMILMIFILPWTALNYLAYDDFLLLNSNAGYALYSSQHPFHGTSFREFVAVPLPDDLITAPKSEAEWDRILMQRGLQFIFDDPVRYIQLSFSRLIVYLKFWPAANTPMINNIGRGSFPNNTVCLFYSLCCIAHD